jgi:4-hydroxy-tetrahydrodipicolinate reductase
MSIRIAVHGAAGRTGRRVVALAAVDPELAVVAAIEAPGHPRLGDDAGLIAGVREIGVPLSDRLDGAADVVVDFSLPAAAERVVEVCRERKIALVEATTGFDEPQVKKIRAAAHEIAVLWSPNMSLAVNLTMKLTEEAARALRERDADVEIIERHHRFKEDSPSGTALTFGRIVADMMGQTEHRHGREGRPGCRPHREIGFHAIRSGDNPGEHTIVFGMLGETIELTVRATSRDCYAVGALAAAKFLIDRGPGLYGMKDVLGP